MPDSDAGSAFIPQGGAWASPFSSEKLRFRWDLPLAQVLQSNFHLLPRSTATIRSDPTHRSVMTTNGNEALNLKLENGSEIQGFCFQEKQKC
ncbi:MAG: hypothetical protein HZT40_21290 [Candidatus Thiothrix singaporensis]|uniref:Uncharacterized protein n=1 Tax=Candidatus Thiothrix singaporensis TaxID=2799669 RepID=A0A7L6AX25_9GAMM|nr:MAG: hypothetical protein HZT40_21290 [Candidatus Thiothrix singaporensis]